MRFILPGDLYHGKDALETLKVLAGKEAVAVMGGGSIKWFSLLDKVVDYLKEVGTEVQSFEGVELDSFVDTVLKDAAAMQEFEPDWIVVVGGGPPIDAIEAVWAFYEHPDTSFEDLIAPFSFPTLRIKAKFCAISSTPGTATEVTAFSVITDYEKGIKYPPADSNITLDVAIVNPALVETMSKKLTIHTGTDAMTHAIEAYVSAFHYEYTDPLTLHVIEMINEYLIPSYNRDMEVHDKMHDAQCLAGMALPNVLLGIVYSMAYKTGAVHSDDHIAYGCANVICLPKVIKLSSKEPKAAVRYAKIAKFINPPGTMDEGLTDALVVRLLEMNKVLNIPACIKDYEGGIIDEKEFMDKLPKVAELTIDNAYIGSNPRTVTPEVMEWLLKCCYYDEEVDF